MIIWTRWGILAAVALLVALGLTQLSVDSIVGVDGYYTEHSWPNGIGFILGALLTYMLSLKLKDEEKIVIDAKSGQQLKLVRRHTLFWINIRVWPRIMVTIGIILVAAEFVA